MNADDMLLYLSKPLATIPHVKDLIFKYRYFSGYKVNVDETMSMDIDDKISKTIKLLSGFKWPTDCFRYLGMKILTSFEKLYDANYKHILQNISKDLDCWSTFTLSLSGHNESVRLNVSPKLFYLFWMLHIDIPKITLYKLEMLISKFIWQGKRQRIRLKTMQLSKTNGGLKLPDLRQYFWATLLKPLIVGIQDLSCAHFLNIEKSLCRRWLQTMPFIEVPVGETKMGEWTRVTSNILEKNKTDLGYCINYIVQGFLAYLLFFFPGYLPGSIGWSLLAESSLLN